MNSSVQFNFFLLILYSKTALACLDGNCRVLAFPSSLFLEGERLVNHTMVTISLIDKDTCQFRCYLEHNCVSINFNIQPREPETENCELNNSTGKKHEKDLIKAANYVYHGTKNACDSSPCKNNATCQSGFTSQRYRCLCPPEFTGHNCGHIIDKCEINPCLNRGSCREGRCQCEPGFSGEFCEIVIADQCDSNKCQNNGNCVGGKCECLPGYSGENCEHDVDECLSGVHSCHSSASCTNTVGSYKCSCNSLPAGDGISCNLASECQSYRNLSYGDRKITSGYNRYCDAGLFGWYRFSGAAGTRMATSCPPIRRCGSAATGWLRGGHPTVVDGQVLRWVCFHWNSRCCWWYRYIRVRNCGAYYVYYLRGTLICDLRYCSTD